MNSMPTDTGQTKFDPGPGFVRPPSRFTGGRIFGAVCLIVLGIAVFLDNIGLLRFQDIWKFWPIYLLGVGFAKASAGRHPQDRSWGVLLVIVGVLFLAWNLGVYHLPGSGFGWFIGLLLVGFGVSSLIGVLFPDSPWAPGIWGGGRRWAHRNWSSHRTWSPVAQGPTVGNSEPVLSNVAIFGSCKRRVESQAFKGGEAQVICGEIKYDLRLASIPPGNTAVIDVQVIFGAVKLRVPYNWRVSMQVQGAFGAGDDKTAPDPRVSGPGPVLVITGSYLFGAVEVEN